MNPSEELNQAPLLRQLKQQADNASEPPEGYFEANAASWEDQLADDAVMQSAPTLQKAGQRLPLRVPVGYFDRLPQRILARVHEAEAAAVRPLWPTLGYRLAAIAAVLGLLWLLWLPNRGLPSAEPELAWQDLPTEALLALAEDEVDDPDLIFEMMGTASLTPRSTLEEPALDAWLEEVDVADLEEALLEADPSLVP